MCHSDLLSRKNFLGGVSSCHSSQAKAMLLPCCSQLMIQYNKGTGAGPLLPNMEHFKRAIFTPAPHDVAEVSSELHCSLKCFLPNPLSSSLSFPMCQTCITIWESCSLPLLPLPSVFHRYFPQRISCISNSGLGPLSGLPDLTQLPLHVCNPGFLAVLQTLLNYIYSRVFAEAFSSLWNVIFTALCIDGYITWVSD